MKTEVSEIADKIYRLSTFMPQSGRPVSPLTSS